MRATRFAKLVASIRQAGAIRRGERRPSRMPQAEAVALMLEKHEVCRARFHGFDWSRWTTGTSRDRLSLLPNAQQHVLAQADGKNRLLRQAALLSQHWAAA